MIGQLRDRLEILDEEGNTLQTVPAQVGMNRVPKMRPGDAGTGEQILYVAEEIRAIIAPNHLATLGRSYRWRGEIYNAPTRPIVRRRGAQDHHFTITLELAT